MKNGIWLWAFIFVFVPFSHAVEQTYIHKGFSTGEEFLNMSIIEQRAYGMGIVDGMLLAPLFDAPRPKMLWVEKCIVGMTDSQVTAILAKYLKDHPGRWHETPHVPMYSALRENCPD